MSSWLRVALTLLSVFVGATAMWMWVHIFKVSLDDLLHLARNIAWWTVPPIFALLCLHVLLSAHRWGLIETALGGQAQPIGRSAVTGAFALGLGTILPGPIANVLCRGLSNRMYGASGTRGALGGGLDQASDFLLACLFAPLAVLALSIRRPDLYLIGFVPLAVLLWWIIRIFPAFLGDWLGRIVPARFKSIPWSLERRLVETMFAYSLARLINLSAITVLIHYASDTATVAAAITAVPPVTVAISLAMLPGGFGVSEWSFTGAFAALGMPSSEIATFVLANRVILTCLGLAVAMAGLLVTLWVKPQRK